MKRRILFPLLLLFYTATVMAQINSGYTDQWKKVEALEKKGLTASALKEVQAIYNMAAKDHNDAQQIKAGLYQVKYRSMVEEDSYEKNIFFTDTLISRAKAPVKNILLSIQAEMLWQYLQNHRWQFYNRTELKEENSKDISTWSLGKLHASITRLYKASLDPATEKQLKNTALESFEAILIKGENTRQLRPSLYDFLAFRALNYFMTDERDITRPAYQFTINDAAVFAPAETFIRHSFATKDTASLQYQAIGLLQQIIGWHINDNKPHALLDADLIRLNFVYEHAVNDNKQTLYEAALKDIEDRYSNDEAVTQAMYLRARIYYNRGLEYDPFNKTANQYEIRRAKELLEAAVKKYPKSEGGINAQNLLNSILQPSLQLATEKVNTPGAPFRTLVNYKNVKKLYLRWIKVTKDYVKKADRRDYDKIWHEYVSLEPTRAWSIALPDPLDYQQHAAEIKIDAAENGIYFLLASINENFSMDKNIIAKQLVYVSNIGYIHNNDNDYYVLHRESGQPLADAQVQVWETKYNYTGNRNEEIKAERYQTDKNGFFRLSKSKEYRNIHLQIQHGSDELFLDDNIYNYSYNGYEQPKRQTQTFLFTDRSIYRPGQIVYFKGIIINKEGTVANSSVQASFPTTVYLRDANGQKINQLHFITNEFGSYHGSFKLPEGTLNGNFSLYDSAGNGYHDFSVEEYKRPKFSVEIKKPEGSYRINDSIKVTGTAKAYAGNNIDGAAVKYRVVRKVRYPIWWDYGFNRRSTGRKILPPYGSNEEVEIIHGNTTTDSRGLFDITFKALADESIDKKVQPTFYYEVNADITDVNGETRSGNTTVAVAYQALQLNIEVADKLSADSLHTLKVRSTNLNDIFEKTKVNISITQLEEPAKIFRERYWDVPDQFVMSRDEFAALFPYDAYQEEDKKKNWKLLKEIVAVTDSTQKRAGIGLRIHKGTEAGRLFPGWYKITVTAVDKFGEPVKAEKFIQLTGETTTTNDAVTVNVKNTSAEPGEKISYDIKTGFSKIWLIHTLNRMNDRKETKVIEFSSLPSAVQVFVQGVTEEDRGGINMNYAFVKHNRVYTGNENFNVPWNNKELAVTYETFRDKLLPGANETWTVKISGNKGEKVAAEMLAAMYDASVDQFRSHNWNRIAIWPTLYNNINWLNEGFIAINAENYNRIYEKYVSDFSKSYDRLLSFFGEGFLNEVVTVGYGNGKRNANRKMEDATAPMAAAERLDGNEEIAKHMKLPKPVLDDSDGDGITDLEDKEPNTPSGNKVDKNGVAIRKNFNETAFFFPELRTDTEGNVAFSTALPEALTQWKLMTLAHTKDLKSGYSEKILVTQKPLMVQPNAPRFVREGDKMEFSAKVVNLSESDITGTATLELLDAATGNPVNAAFKNDTPSQNFTVKAGQSAAVLFHMNIPLNFNSALTYRIVAKARDFSDGEEMSIPVLTNRTLVTESMPLHLRGNEKNKHFQFTKLLNSNSRTLNNHALTVEYTSNPVWYAVQALPYLMEYPYECAEQTFNRYYANMLAAHIANSNPAIKAVFEKWKNVDSSALMSNLQKNEALKSALLQETPWVMDAQNEAQQKKNIALLFDLIRLSNESSTTLSKLNEMQSSNGGFVWFKGGPDDRYITQYIITGVGHLKKLGVITDTRNLQQNNIMTMVKKALPYLDKKIKEDYDLLIKSKVKLAQNNLGYTAVQYLYMRSFFPEIPIAAASQTAANYYTKQAKQYWLSNGKYMQAMIALALHRNGDAKTPALILRSLKENAINNEEQGMYWKEWTSNRGWFWYQAPVESQALIIEAFTDISKNQQVIDDLKTWLLKQKQTQNWGTTKATAEACYVLLLNGANWLQEDKKVVIHLGNTAITNADTAEAGTGYFKQRIEGKAVTPAMGNIKVEVQSSIPATGNSSSSWGSVYWQYFEDLDKITVAATPLKLARQLFVERATDKGPVLDAVKDGALLKVSDKVIVRIELRVDRDMEYVHMKDMRAACMEPLNVISAYKYQDGLGYYESTKDASTHFFFNWLKRGTYVFEYPLFVTHDGDFSHGITTIQCMYAPEFMSHSEGVRVLVR